MEKNINIIPKIIEGTSIIGRQIRHYESVSSTMETAKKLAEEGASEGTVIIAETQTSGRGRLKRSWVSPENNLYLSIILRPSLNILSELIMIASVSIAKTIISLCGVDARIKWPNDVLIGDKKVCGILIENKFESNKLTYSIVGIGVNLQLDPSEYSEISSTATSLKCESAKYFSRVEFIKELLVEFEKNYLNSKSGRSAYYEWCRYMDIAGKSIKVKSGEDILQGIVEKVVADGSLMVRDSNGNIHEVLCGDVSVIKD